MGRRRIDMDKIYEIWALKEQGRSQREVSQLLKINRETVIKYWDKKNHEGGLDLVPDWAAEIDWKNVKEEIEKNKTPKKILYEEYEGTKGLPSYQAFCKYIKKNLPPSPPEVTIRIDRNPGVTCEVDYSGNGNQIINPSTGEIIKVELFVGTLAFSSAFYAEFTYTQQLEDFVNAHNGMFHFFGGVPRILVPDNCRTAVIKSSKMDPKFNKTYLDMSHHYQIALDPADVRKPKHKPHVERSISIIQKGFYPKIRKKAFTSLWEINRELRTWIDQLMDKPVGGKGMSRRALLEKERKFLRPLPTKKYEIFYFKKAKVHPDCHFHLNKNYYSVPYENIGKEIEVKFNNKIVHAYINCERIASHSALKGSNHYSTNPKHYPAKKVVELNYHLKKARKEAKEISEDFHVLIERVINVAKFPLKNLRKVQGLLGLRRKYGREQLTYAAKKAIELDTLNFHNIKRFAHFYQEQRPITNEKAPVRDGKLIYLRGDFDENSDRLIK